MGDKKPETASQVLEALTEFLHGELADFKTMPPDDVKRYLDRHNLSAGDVMKTARAAIRQAQGHVKLRRARERRLGLRQKLSALKAGTEATRAALLEQIKSLAGSETAAVFARRFEKAPDEDLSSLLDDFELLEHLELPGHED